MWSACQGRGAYMSWPRLPVNGSKSAQKLFEECTSLRFLDAHAPGPSLAPKQLIVDPPSAVPLRLPLQPQSLPAPPSDPSTTSALKGLLFISEWGKDRKMDASSNLTRKAHTFYNLAARSAPTNAADAEGTSLVGSQLALDLPGGEVHGLRSLGSSALDLVHCASGSVDIMWEGAAWEWDVCAGLAILREAGGLCTDGNAPPQGSKYWESGGVRLPPASLGGRRFLCVRPATARPLLLASEEEKTAARDAQERIAREVWKRLHLQGLDYKREGAEYLMQQQ